jgi:serine/threonine protein kinase
LFAEFFEGDGIVTNPQPDPDATVKAEETSVLSGQWSGVTQPTTAPEGLKSGSTSGARRVGPYLLEAQLGSGGFGEVWLATREGELAHTRLAVKLPHASHLEIAAVRQEAGLWAKIGSHPNILPIFEATVYDGQIVIVSEYAADGSLAEWLRKHGGKAPTPDEAARICLGVLAGLEHLHSKGIIHRDIKPANVLLQSGVPRLADFGLSRMLHTENPTGQSAGTPAFMAPEAFDGVRSIQTDIWSVGVMLYLLLSGTLPFSEREWLPMLKSILMRNPPFLPPDIPETYEDVLREGLAKDPAQRFHSASHMAAKLKFAMGESGAASTSVRLLTHIAAFAGSNQIALFVNATNLSETVDREVTHVWIDANPKVFLANKLRPLPKRLKPQETWETWIDLWRIPSEVLNEELTTLARARLSTGDIICAIENKSVPESGWVPGKSVIENLEHETGYMQDIHPSIPHFIPLPKKRPWWRFW